jgi:sugar phosphate isomerase/epimerase
MKKLVLLSLLAMSSSAAADFREHLGLQLYSLRSQFEKEVPATLDLVQSWGITEVETWDGMKGVTVAQEAELLKARGLRAVSAHMGYGAMKKDINAVIRDAQTLGVKFVIVPSLPKSKEGFTAEDAHKIAADFNAFGAACKAAGLRFGNHPHGPEFRPTGGPDGETAFDILVRETQPELVCFELDVFWAYHAGQDPVKLLEKYPNRWVMLHVKDMRKGAPRGLFTGGAPPTDKVVVGEGEIDWPAILRVAQKIGIAHYLLEDETLTPLEGIPASVRRLQALKL